MTEQAKITARNVSVFYGANQAINDELRKPAPSMATIQASAATLDTLAPHVPGW